ncbi:MAG TPA: chlorite dismutase family protein [Chthoniobacterales bacterium]
MIPVGRNRPWFSLALPLGDFFITPQLMDNRFYTFVGGDNGQWRILAIHAVIGESLETAPFLDIKSADLRDLPTGARWLLRGVTSNQRYVTRSEQSSLVAIQAPLGRPEASCAALIPITKTAAWWLLTQDERREIFEARSSHIATGLRYLPAIARRLHHGRDLGEPFDFLTWFEYAPSDAAAFDELVTELRATEEWNYVEREVDIRLVRSDNP